MHNTQKPAEQVALHTMRQLLLVLVTAGMLGTAADLLLLEHFENAWQLPPLVLIGIALLVVAWLFIGGGPVTVIAMRIIMICFIAVGCVGILLHYNGNSEFQREIDPTLHGWALVVKVMTAKAPPALAPASMIQLGLLGLLYTYRHPSLHWLVRDEASKRSRP
jgi:peptidoglycan/LPS O-acetylase OafA/YrhL